MHAKKKLHKNSDILITELKNKQDQKKPTHTSDSVTWKGKENNLKRQKMAFNWYKAKNH